MDKIKETLGIREKFSLENAQHLCDEVKGIEESAPGNAPEQQRSKMLAASLQSIRSLTEVLLWMDRNHEEWFERVMERDVINTLERLVTNGLMPSAIKLQSLQSVTMMLQNLSRISSIYYVCSNNHINRMVAVQFDMHDDEFVSLYVSFLKTLALRCTPDTVQFFFDQQDNAFPLWDRAVRLLGSSDAMVRTAAKQIIVTVARLQDSAVSTFVQHAVADVFYSVLRNVDEQLTQLAADIPSHALLQRFVHSARAAPAGGTVQPSSSPSPSPSPSPSQQQQPAVKTRALTLQLESIEDELLYLNDVCRTPVPNTGRQAAAAAQRIFLSRFQRIVEQETRAAAAAAVSPATSSPSSPAGAGFPQPHATFSRSASSFNDAASDIPASVALAFLLYWIQINTDLHVCAALMGFLVHPMEFTNAAPTLKSNGNNGDSRDGGDRIAFSMAALILQSSRVDLHEAVAAIFEHAVVQCASAPPARQDSGLRSSAAETTATTSPPLLHFPTSLSQFFYAETPYQQTGKVLVGGPSSTLPPPREKFVQKAWVGDSRSNPVNAADGERCGNTVRPPAPQEALSMLIPHLFTALHTQLRFFHVTRLSCFSSTLSLLVKLLPTDTRATQRSACVKVWETAFLELMKLIQRYLLDGVKQYAAVIQRIVRALENADGVVPLSRINFADIQDSREDEEEAPLPIRDPYAVMFLKLREAAQWLDADVPDRVALLTAAHTKNVLHLFFPAFPMLYEETCDLMLNVWPPLRALPFRSSASQLQQQLQQQPAQPLRDQLANAYRTVQLSLTRAFDLPLRSPVAASECELNLYVMFLLARHVFQLCAVVSYNAAYGDNSVGRRGKTDILRQTLRRLCPQLRPCDYFTLSSSTAALSVRCELASEWHENVGEAAFAALGTPLCLVLPSAPTGEDGRALLFLDVIDNAPEQIREQKFYAVECKRRVLLSLDLSFVGIALHPRYPFKVTLSYQLAGHAMLLHVVMCDAATARAVVLEVEKAANECRSRGASLCFGMMNYRSALLD
jgi:protein CLEC16A